MEDHPSDLFYVYKRDTGNPAVVFLAADLSREDAEKQVEEYAEGLCVAKMGSEKFVFGQLKEPGKAVPQGYKLQRTPQGEVEILEVLPGYLYNSSRPTGIYLGAAGLIRLECPTRSSLQGIMALVGNGSTVESTPSGHDQLSQPLLPKGKAVIRPKDRLRKSYLMEVLPKDDLFYKILAARKYRIEQDELTKELEEINVTVDV